MSGGIVHSTGAVPFFDDAPDVETFVPGRFYFIEHNCEIMREAMRRIEDGDES